MDKLGRSVPTIPSGCPWHLYRHFVASLSMFFKSCSLPYITNDGGSLLLFVTRRMEIQTCRKKGYYHIGFCRPTGCELQESPEQSCRNIQKLVQVPNHSTLQESHSISVQLCVSLFCHVTILVLYNWILLTVHEILQRSLNTSCHISGLELSNCYGLFAERSRPIQRHERHIEQVINSSHTTSITIAFEINYL